MVKPVVLASIITVEAPCLNPSVILVTGVFGLIPFSNLHYSYVS
jgi:hypothetical protein